MEYRRAYHHFSRVWSNELGCFDYWYDRQDQFIYLVGDSFTWGFVPLENTWGAILERVLGARTLKCGVGGYGTHQERIKIERLIGKVGIPRLIIVGYFTGNDLTDDYLFPNYTVIQGYWAKNVNFDLASGGRRVLSDEEIQTNLHEFLRTRTLSTRKRFSHGILKSTTL